VAAHIAVTKSYYKYQGDDSVIYRLKVADYIATQVNGDGDSIIGATAAVGTEPKLGGGQKLRRALFRNTSTHKDREVVILTPDAPLFTDAQGGTFDTLNLNDPSGSSTYTYEGHFLTQTRNIRA
jgi:hypothetical protein